MVSWPLTKRPAYWPLRRVKPEHRFDARLTDLWIPTFRVASEDEWEQLRRVDGGELARFPPCVQSTASVQFLETYYAFFDGLPRDPREYATRLRLTPDLQIKLTSLQRTLLIGRPNIGVHIRTVAAHAKTVASSPLDWFLAQMERLRQEHPGCAFFLSCDSLKASRELRARFSGTIHEQTSLTGFNTRRGIRKALLDLMLLSRCDHILGSYWSSFSEMAYLLQGSRSYEDARGTVPVSQPPVEELSVRNAVVAT